MRLAWANLHAAREDLEGVLAQLWGMWLGDRKPLFPASSRLSRAGEAIPFYR